MKCPKCDGEMNIVDFTEYLYIVQCEDCYYSKAVPKGDDGMTKNMFIVVNHEKGQQFLGETKHNYLLPIADPKAMCILLNYVLRNGDIPVTDTLNWWDKEELQEYYMEDDWGR